jgi:phytol kinase
MNILFVLLVVLALLLMNEAWGRSQRVHSELSRKFVHITVGSFVAFWPYLLSWNQIRLLSVGFLLVVAASRYLKIFKAIHSVQRPTWGEFFFAVAVGTLSFVEHHPHIYTAALLAMSLADGMAAVVGTRYGGRRRYRVLGSTKSLAGSLTFLVICVLILIVYSHTSVPLPVYKIASISLVATLLENLGAYGSDNLLVPLLIGGWLLQF